jgi:deferrochelatase/peroxidase EfeB
LRKLEQDVQAFRAFEEAIDLSAVPVANRPKDAGALLVGRERDGAPLIAPAPADPSQNNFDFDAAVSRCPFHAHIRKANPRVNDGVPSGSQGARSENNQRTTQFVRRGTVYDKNNLLPTPPPADYPKGVNITAGDEVGLLFMAYMANISVQFFPMQMNWFARNDFPFPGTNLGDAIMRPTAVLDENGRASWPWPSLPNGTPALSRFVTTRGGAFFYAPAIGWMKKQ